MKITRNLIIGNTVYMAAAGIVAQLINLFVLPLFVTRLGSDLYGVYVLGSLLLGYIGTFSAGFNEGIQKHISDAWTKDDRPRLAEVITTGIGILFLVGVLLGGVAFLGADALMRFFRVEQQHYTQAVALLRLCGGFAVFYWPMQITTLILRARLRLKLVGVLTAMETVVHSIVMVVSVLFIKQLYLIKAAELSVRLLFWVPTLILAVRLLPPLNWRWFRIRPERAGEMSRFSFGMMYGAVLSLLTTRIDSLVIGRMIGMSSITAYTVVSKYFYIIRQYVGMLYSNIMPTIYNLCAQGDTARMEKFLNRGIRYRAMVSFPFAFAGLVIIRPFIQLWMGNDFASHAIWGELMALIPLFTAQGFAQAVVRGSGQVRACNVIYSVQVFSNLIISVALTPVFGIGGPVLGTLLTVIFIGDVVFYPYYCKLLKMSCREAYITVLKTAACCIPPVLIARWITAVRPVESWIELILLSAGVVSVQYLILMFMMLDREDARNIGTVIGHIPVIGKKCEQMFFKIIRQAE
jgi:O-antigen/teichoic acid export membrane protein